MPKGRPKSGKRTFGVYFCEICQTKGEKTSPGQRVCENCKPEFYKKQARKIYQDKKEQINAKDKHRRDKKRWGKTYKQPALTFVNIFNCSSLTAEKFIWAIENRRLVK